METAPIELHLYDEDDQVIDTLSRTRIPSYLLDIAIDLQSKLAENEEGPQDTNALFDFIVEFYGHKIDREQLKKQTDLIECMTVLRSVLARASGLALEFAQKNPQGPSRKKK
jgi:hypothetical protein